MVEGFGIGVVTSQLVWDMRIRIRAVRIRFKPLCHAVCMSQGYDSCSRWVSDSSSGSAVRSISRATNGATLNNLY